MTGPEFDDLAERVAATFVEGALAAVPVGAVVTDWESLKVAGVAALTGGVAAVLALARAWAKLAHARRSQAS